MHSSKPTITCDKSIRLALQKQLEKNERDIRIINELGILHGEARIDLAVISEGTMHGYELKSDIDTLTRLPEQMRIYNTVFNKLTLVVGKKHILEAIKIIPDWWGISIAKVTNKSENILLQNIREAELNPNTDSVSMARLLWREEAINLLETLNKADGIRSKPRDFVYKRLAEVLDKQTLGKIVSEYLCSREDWRVEIPCIPCDD
jgi:hypothetical protein